MPPAMRRAVPQRSSLNSQLRLWIFTRITALTRIFHRVKNAPRPSSFWEGTWHGRPGRMDKTKVVFPFSDGVSPGRPDDIRPYRPSGRIFHAMREISGLKNYLRRDRKLLVPHHKITILTQLSSFRVRRPRTSNCDDAG